MNAITLSDLKSLFTGSIITPDDPAYGQARKVMNRKGSPAIVAMAATTEDVQLALKYAMQCGLVLSIRSGGHAPTGLSTNDGGIIIDVSRMNGVTLIDEETRHVRIGAGAQWGDIAETLHAWSLALSSGDTKTVGASGLMLGGGIGWMVRKYGLAIDSLVRVEIVTADGQLVVADEQTNTDLFWALRGGGGNFGIVTAFECIAHPIGNVFSGNITYAPDDAEKVLRGWRDYMRIAPEELTTMALLLPQNAMGEHPAMCVVSCCWATDNETDMQAAIAPLRAISSVLEETVELKPYYEVLEEAHPPQGIHVETNNVLVDELSDTIIDKVLYAYSEYKSIVQLRSLGAAMGRVSVDATAFAHRNSEAMILVPTFMSENVSRAEMEEALLPWRTIATEGTGAYVNFFSQTTDKERSAAYPSKTYQRLSAIKKQYDPMNIFNQNINIVPDES